MRFEPLGTKQGIRLNHQTNMGRSQSFVIHIFLAGDCKENCKELRLGDQLSKATFLVGSGDFRANKNVSESTSNERLNR